MKKDGILKKVNKERKRITWTSGLETIKIFLTTIFFIFIITMILFLFSAVVIAIFSAIKP